MDAARIGPNDLDLIVYSPQTNSTDILHEISRNPYLQPEKRRIPTRRLSHHLGHAISGYVRSGFQDAVILVMDGLGSHTSDLPEDEARLVKGGGWGAEIISLYEARGTSVRPLIKQIAPEGRWLPEFFESNSKGISIYGSVGGMYSAAAMKIFGDPMEAGKVMGLAPFGTPLHAPHELYALSGTEVRFLDTLNASQKFSTDGRATFKDYANLAATVQNAVERLLIEFLHETRSLTSSKNLVFSGGVALNGVANEVLAQSQRFDRYFFDPAADDAGIAIGAAYWGACFPPRDHDQAANETNIAKLPAMQETDVASPRLCRTDSLGRVYSAGEIELAISQVDGVRVVERNASADSVAAILGAGGIVAWFSGGSEFGPRSLGHRSILCDPRNQERGKFLNEQIKQRESFRPLAPAVMLEHVNDWFSGFTRECESPFMLRVVKFKPEKTPIVPAVVHIDGTGRLQTVAQHDNPKFHELLNSFHELTDVPILLNTSMNIAGEPIVETPLDALWFLLSTHTDYLFLDGILLERTQNDFLQSAVPELTVSKTGQSGGTPGFWSLIDGKERLVEHSMLTPQERRFLELVVIGQDFEKIQVGLRWSENFDVYKLFNRLRRKGICRLERNPISLDHSQPR